MLNFWESIKKPIISLAPMEDVTDTAFRELVMRISNPEHLDVLFTEFTSTDGLCHEVGRENVIKRFKISDSERRLLDQTNTKIVAQIWGTDPEKYYHSAKFIADEMDFDGIDINMGCPVKKIVKNGACSALINTPELAKEIIQATMEGSSLPVSVKTRSGIKQHQTDTWMSHLLETKPAAITLHGRTQKDMSEVPADWEEVGRAAQLRYEIHPDTLIFGNGDIQSVDDAHKKCRQYNLDGAMIARGIFGNPWIFNPGYHPGLDERLDILLLHTQLFDDYWQNDRNFAVLRRFYKIYVQGFPGASKLRASLMNAKEIDQVKKIIGRFKKESLRGSKTSLI